MLGSAAALLGRFSTTTKGRARAFIRIIREIQRSKSSTSCANSVFLQVGTKSNPDKGEIYPQIQLKINYLSILSRFINSTNRKKKLDFLNGVQKQCCNSKIKILQFEHELQVIHHST